MLYAENIGCNLLSTGKFTHSSYKIVFMNGACKLIKQGTTVASCEHHDGMYKLRCNVIEKSAQALNVLASSPAKAATSTPLPISVWYRTPPMGLRLDVAGALLNKRVPAKAFLYDDIQTGSSPAFIYDRF